METFKAGERVSNSVYGEGRVLAVVTDTLVNVLFDTDAGGSNLIAIDTEALHKTTK